MYTRKRATDTSSRALFTGSRRTTFTPSVCQTGLENITAHNLSSDYTLGGVCQSGPASTIQSRKVFVIQIRYCVATGDVGPHTLTHIEREGEDACMHACIQYERRVVTRLSSRRNVKYSAPLPTPQRGSPLSGPGPRSQKFSKTKEGIVCWL